MGNSPVPKIPVNTRDSMPNSGKLGNPDERVTEVSDPGLQGGIGVRIRHVLFQSDFSGPGSSLQQRNLTKPMLSKIH